MKTLLLHLFLLSSLISFSGGFIFPNIEYTSAKLFLFNIYTETPSEIDKHIYADGVYAPSKLGDGIDLSEELLSDIHQQMARGIEELNHGLGKCYIPRHGIIYYDQSYQPVASFSLCFECDQISLWSQQELQIPTKSPKKFDLEKAEAQMANWEKLLLQAGIPASKTNDEYKKHVESNANYKHVASIEFTGSIDTFEAKKYSQVSVYKWLKNTSHGDLEKEVNTEITAGGEEYHFTELVGPNGTSFLFSSNEEDAYLVEAYITNPAIVLPNGISVGMSLLDVQQSFTVWDGLSNPGRITVKTETHKLTYIFKYHTLQAIRLEIML
ncbi:MAG: hypothetical protein MI810_09985 [Flavobacteriales bacterium]|nr:hypothetical protein [Flavobacteriales bacterium]